MLSGQTNVSVPPAPGCALVPTFPAHGITLCQLPCLHRPDTPTRHAQAMPHSTQPGLDRDMPIEHSCSEPGSDPVGGRLTDILWALHGSNY